MKMPTRRQVTPDIAEVVACREYQQHEEADVRARQAP